jgi:hypothetical protein
VLVLHGTLASPGRRAGRWRRWGCSGQVSGPWGRGREREERLVQRRYNSWVQSGWGGNWVRTLTRCVPFQIGRRCAHLLEFRSRSAPARRHSVHQSLSIGSWHGPQRVQAVGGVGRRCRCRSLVGARPQPLAILRDLNDEGLRGGVPELVDGITGARSTWRTRWRSRAGPTGGAPPPDFAIRSAPACHDSESDPYSSPWLVQRVAQRSRVPLRRPRA